MAKFTDPIEVRGQRIKHRILMSAMTTSRAEEDGAPSAWSHAHYKARAHGGSAICFSEATYVNQEGKGFPNQLGTHDDALVPPLGELIQAVEEAGAPARRADLSRGPNGAQRHHGHGARGAFSRPASHRG